MLNKDHLRRIFAEEKSLLKLNEVRYINVPRFDELSVENLENQFKSDAQLQRYLPDKLPKGRMPDRTYYFNVMNTLYPDYMAELIANANGKRYRVSDGEADHGGIKVSDDWWEQLNAVPFLTRKYSNHSNDIRT